MPPPEHSARRQVEPSRRGVKERDLLVTVRVAGVEVTLPRGAAASKRRAAFFAHEGHTTLLPAEVEALQLATGRKGEALAAGAGPGLAALLDALAADCSGLKASSAACAPSEAARVAQAYALRRTASKQWEAYGESWDPFRRSGQSPTSGDVPPPSASTPKLPPTGRTEVMESLVLSRALR